MGSAATHTQPVLVTPDSASTPPSRLSTEARPGFLESRLGIGLSWVATVIFGLLGLLMTLGAVNPLERWETPSSAQKGRR